jgi:hypothetical protein
MTSQECCQGNKQDEVWDFSKKLGYLQIFTSIGAFISEIYNPNLYKVSRIVGLGTNFTFLSKKSKKSLPESKFQETGISKNIPRGELTCFRSTISEMILQNL